MTLTEVRGKQTGVTWKEAVEDAEAMKANLPEVLHTDVRMAIELAQEKLPQNPTPEELDAAITELQISLPWNIEEIGGIEVRAPKYGSERQVFLAPSLVSMLSEHLASSSSLDEASWLFAGEQRDPPAPNTVDHRWRTLRKKASVGEGIRLHDMRHFYASGLIAAGCDVVTVQRALGHASATTTLNTYSHLWPTAEDRTRNAAEGLVLATSRQLLRTLRGPGLRNRVFTCSFAENQVLKRNSTTSPSRMT